MGCTGINNYVQIRFANKIRVPETSLQEGEKDESFRTHDLEEDESGI